MRHEDLLARMQGKPGWSEEELTAEMGLTPSESRPMLESMFKAGLVRRSPRGNWRVAGAAKTASPGGSESWGRRTRTLIYSPELLVDCPKFTRNTFLHFVEDEDHHFRLRDYVDGKRIEVKEIKGITLSRELAVAYPRFELEFDDEEEVTPLTDNEFWQKRIEAHNNDNRDLLDRSATTVEAGHPDNG